MSPFTEDMEMDSFKEFDPLTKRIRQVSGALEDLSGVIAALESSDVTANVNLYKVALRSFGRIKTEYDLGSELFMILPSLESFSNSPEEGLEGFVNALINAKNTLIKFISELFSKLKALVLRFIDFMRTKFNRNSATRAATQKQLVAASTSSQGKAADEIVKEMAPEVKFFEIPIPDSRRFWFFHAKGYCSDPFVEHERFMAFADQFFDACMKELTVFNEGIKAKTDEIVADANVLQPFDFRNKYGGLGLEVAAQQKTSINQLVALGDANEGDFIGNVIVRGDLRIIEIMAGPSSGLPSFTVKTLEELVRQHDVIERRLKAFEDKILEQMSEVTNGISATKDYLHDAIEQRISEEKGLMAIRQPTAAYIARISSYFTVINEYVNKLQVAIGSVSDAINAYELHAKDAALKLATDNK